MTTDVLGSGPFKQPFNKTSSAVRHTGSLMLGSPAENTLPPVSKPSAFGSPRRASIILQGLFKLVGKVLPFFHTVGYVTFRRNSPHMKQILFGLSIQKTIVAHFLWQGHGGRFLIWPTWCWVGHTCSSSAHGISMG